MTSVLARIGAGALVLSQLLVIGCTAPDAPKADRAETASVPEAAAEPPEIAPEARRLIARGDAAEAEAQIARAEMQMIERSLAPSPLDAMDKDPLAWTGSQHRGSTPATAELSPEELDALSARHAELELEVARLEGEARENWDRAIAIDAGAMDAILKRMRGDSSGS